MQLVYELVDAEDEEKIGQVFHILKKCGEYMYENQGLEHWKTPYSKEAIKKDCLEREVYLVFEPDAQQYISTFQLDMKESVRVAYISKFATLPEASGRGVGKKNLIYIEQYCYRIGIFKLCLDVYDKSEHAIKFYISNGFNAIGSRQTKHFQVILMEKELAKLTV